MIYQLRAALEKCTSEWNIKSIRSTIPSLKVIHLPTKIKCDISVCNGMSVHNSKLFAHLFKIQPEAIAFYHFIKRWLRLFEVQKLYGFSLTLVIVFFLQQLNLMPTIKKVQEGVSKVFIDGEWYYLN